MAQIKAQVMLSEINQYAPNQDGKLNTFSIDFIKADGSVSQKMRVRKGGINVQKKDGESDGGKFKYNLKKTGTLLLHNLDTDKPFSVKISRIIRYNGMEVSH